MKNLQNLSLVLCLGLLGCSSEPPKCSDKETISILKSILIDHTQIPIDKLLKTHFSEQKLSQDSISQDNIFFENIRSAAYDEKVKKLSCEASLVIPEVDARYNDVRSSTLGYGLDIVYLTSFNEIENLGEKFVFHIKYDSQLNDNNEQIVIINNLSDTDIKKISFKFVATLFAQVILPTPKADGFYEESVGGRGEDL